MNGEATAISEKFSEKPKRGRPRAFSETMEHAYQAYGLFTDTKTRRGRVNICYRQHALYVIKGDPRLAWLFDSELIRTQEHAPFRRTILTELGRIPNDEDLRAVALRICELKPTTKEAVAMIRRFRLGRPAVGSVEGLWDVLARTINEYQASHPEITRTEMLRALEIVSDLIREPLTEAD